MFIDIHVHTTVWPGPARAANAENYARPEQLIEMYDAVGIAMAVMLPSTNPEGTHVIQSNEEIIEIARKYPDRMPGQAAFRHGRVRAEEPRQRAHPPEEVPGGRPVKRPHLASGL